MLATNPTSAPKTSFRGLALIGGHPMLDLTNTVKYRGADDPQDKLCSYADLMEWASLAGLITKAESKTISRAQNADDLLLEALNIREYLWVILNQALVENSKYITAISELEKAISALRPKISIDPETGILSRRVVIATPQDLISRIIEAAADLLADRDALRIKICDGCDCDWLFIDKTKAGRRRWCDTKTCGNLARVREFRKKHELPN